VIYANEPSPSGSRRPRHRDPLPLCRCPEGGRVSGSRRLYGGRGARSAYDAWATSAAHPAAERQREEARLAGEIRRIHTRSGGVYGSPRVTAEPRRRGWRVNHKRVERLLRRHGIVGFRPRRRRSLTKPDQGAAPAPDLLGRLFDPDRLDLAWCGDVTYIPTDEGWRCLASVIDLASRHRLGYAMSAHHDAAVVVGALDAAVATRGVKRLDGTIFPTDRGAEYISAACIQACQQLGLRRSMSRTGSCLDNAVAESWFASLKVELVDRAHRPTRADARAAIFAWIAGNTGTPPSTRYHQPWPHDPGVHLPGGGPPPGSRRLTLPFTVRPNCTNPAPHSGGCTYSW
jgi:putative transposase